jgi:hypothetical protein
MSHAASGLQDRHQVDGTGRQPVLLFQRSDNPIDHLDIGSAFDLGQDDAVQSRCDHRLQIAKSEPSVQSVHPHIGPNPVVFSTGQGQRLGHHSPRRRLLGHRHRVF